MHSRLGRFLSYYKPHLRLFLAVTFCAVLVSLVSLVQPLLTRHITKDILENDLTNALPQVLYIGAVMVGLALLQTLCAGFYDYRGHALGALMEADLREELFAHYQKLSFRFFDQNRTGQLLSRITHDLLNLAELYHHAPEDILMNTIKFLGSFIIMFSINGRLTLIVFALLPPFAALAWYFNRKMHAALKRDREEIGNVNADVEDNLSGIRVVQAFANEELEQRKFRRSNRRLLEARQSTYRAEMLAYETIETLTRLLTVAVVVGGAAFIIGGSLDLADLVVFLLYVGYLVEPLQGFMHTVVQYQEGIAGFNRFMDIMETAPDIADAPDALDIGRAQGDIRFSGVSFRYMERQPYVLENLSFHVRPGETVALVGSSGVGKTTVCSLIPRFYDVDAGAILLDGQDIRRISLRSLRGSIGVVQQDTYLFSGTVLENIRYGREDASMEEVVQAAKAAHAHEFIETLPDGYDTDIGQRGVKLSGGQKQRLCIARVFLENPSVLIFDEATSALDYESEHAVHAAMERLSRDRTTFIIAHRLSTVRSADTIIVLGDAGIEEIGSHEALLEAEGAYARMCEGQLG